MLPRDNRPPALPSGLLASPTRAFVRGEMASDGDITRPHNPLPREEVPMGNAPSQWHVHLELRPEQLLALERMGFMTGAHAWRAGMDRWQPLRDGGEPASLADRGAEWSSEEDEELEASGTRRQRGGRQEVLGDLLARPLPPPPHLPVLLPSRSADEGSFEPPLHPERLGGDTGRNRPTSIPPPAILDIHGRQRAVVNQRTLWLGMGATVLTSACVAALVSSIVWNLHSRWRGRESRAEALFAAVGASKPAQRKRVETKPASQPAEPQPTSVSVEQLPLLSGTRRAAPVTITGTGEPTRAEAPQESKASDRSTSHDDALPGRRAPRSAAVADKPARSAIDESIATRVAEEQPASPTATPGPADRDGVARAVAQAAGAAESCGSSPENGQVLVKFGPSGSAQSIQLVKSFSNRDVNACVLRVMSRARIAPFTGDAVSVRKSLRW